MKRKYSEEPSILHPKRKVRRSCYSVKCRRRWMMHWWDVIEDDWDG